ncbi:MAG: hypothetical protein KDB84_05745, partial [Flavobacteriales bacterium]|nr:hypothetical protein [Flavobacteriales bacterium]
MIARTSLSVLLLTVGTALSAQATYDARFEEYVGLKYPCGGEVVPVVKIRNQGSAAMSGCVVDTWKNGLMVNSFDWQLAVPALQGEARTPALPAVQIEPGDELEFRIISVNTVPDEVAEGNIITAAVDQVPAASGNTTVTVEVRTDSDPGDLTWEIRNSLNETVADGGPYVEENAVVVVDVPLGSDACFTFKANDAGRGGGSAARFNVMANGNVLISAEGEALVGGFSKGLTTSVDEACTEPLELELETDASPGETTWEVIDTGTGSVVCTGGGGYPAEGTLLETCCLPEGCYRLRVMDASGNGITGGGYVLRSNGARIIDDRNNFLSGAESAIAAEQGFCLPVGPNDLLYTSCDKYFWKKGEFIVVNEDADVAAVWIPNGSNAVQSATTGYDFWFYDTNGGYSFIRQRRHNVTDGFGNVGS